MSKITPPQLVRINTVYSQWATHEGHPKTREERLVEVSARAGRPITSTSQLTTMEAKKVIDSLQAELGIAETVPARRLTRKDAQKLGTEGRHDQIHDETTIVGPRQLARLKRDMDRLGWDQARLDAFLASSHGPNDRRTTIRTLGEANRVHFAMKHMRPNPVPVKAQATS